VTRPPSSRVSAGIAILALTLAGCATTGPAAPVATNHVDLPPSYLFSPSAITVTAGTTVTWRNSDNFTHSVRLIEANRIVGIMHPGQSVTFIFTAPALYHYDCSFHPQNMKGTVTVTP